MSDHRSRAQRLLDAIFETPKSVIDARNAGWHYAFSDSDAPAYDHTDVTPEGTAFWEGVEAGTKAARRMLQWMGDY